MSLSISKIGLNTVAALVVGGVVAATVTSNTALSLLTQAIIYAVFASGVGLLLRQNGMASFGHALFFGGSGYGVGLLLQTQALPAEAAMLLTLAAVALFAFGVGLVSSGLATSSASFFGRCPVSTCACRGPQGPSRAMVLENPHALFSRIFLVAARCPQKMTRRRLRWRRRLGVTFCGARNRVGTGRSAPCGRALNRALRPRRRRRWARIGSRPVAA